MHTVCAGCVPDFPEREQELWGEPRLESPRSSNAEIEHRYSGIPQAVRNVGAQQTPIGGDINPEALLGRVVDNFVDKFRPQQRLTTHQRQHPAAVVVQPINRTAGYILGHALNLVVIGPAVPAIEIALVLNK